MTDYSTVAPPQNLANNFDPSSAFADALQRARQIAAKINTPNSDGGSNNAVGGGTKRPLEDSAGMDWGEQNVTKKMAALNDPIGAQLAALQQQQRLGLPTDTILTEEFSVPDKMVGLIIGRGGEQITRLQAESSCKIQMAADSGGMPDRPCSLTGRKQAIDKAKDMIMDIVNRGTTSTLEPAGPMSDGLSMVEMMIPASKVGLIIGKGGETIKNLQERAGVKMVMIQDGNFSNSAEKPLRIKGEPQKAEFARQLIMDLLTERELENMNRGGFNRNDSRTNDYGTGSGGMQEVAVPRQAVGVVIGKGGEMIKKIQVDSGARVQFQQEDGPGDRMCFLTGSPDQVQAAQSIIHELINSVLARDQQNMGRGRGRGGGRGNFDDRRSGGGGGRGAGSGGDFMPGNGGMGRGGQQSRGGPPDWVEITYSVPANKCGIVIGKGGETIRAINQQTGAHVELSRNPSANPNEKLFCIRGLPNQIDHAKQLINEKVGGGGGGGPSGANNVPPGGYGMLPGGPSPPQGVPGYPQNNQQPPPGPQGYTPQGWGGGYQHWQQQPGAGNASTATAGAAAGDPNKQAAEANAAAWAAYYAQYYQSQPGAQPAQSQPAAQSQQPPAGQAPPGQNSQNSQAAQPDYSAAWADYYRSMGMYREAELIEQQARVNQTTPGQPAGTPQQPTASQPAGANAQSQPPAQATQPSQQPSSQGQQQYSQYGQYSQYTQQQQGAYPYNYAAAYPQPQ